MKKLQASYNNDADKIIKEATQDKLVKNSNFLIDLAMVTTDTIPVPEETVTFDAAWNLPMQTFMQNGKKPFAKSMLTLTSNRYGARQAKLLCPPINNVLKISGSSRSSAMACSRCISLHVGTVKYLASIFLKTTLR